MPTIISGTNGIDQVQDNVVTTADIQNGAITGAKLSGGQSATVPVYGAVAWCNFNGLLTGTNAPLAGGNVTSVTRNAAGDYTITLTTALQDTNYCVIGTVREQSTSNFLTGVMLKQGGVTSTTQFQIMVKAGNGSSGFDFPNVCIAVFR